MGSDGPDQVFVIMVSRRSFTAGSLHASLDDAVEHTYLTTLNVVNDLSVYPKMTFAVSACPLHMYQICRTRSVFIRCGVQLHKNRPQ